jgi:general secretion pathway protein G
MKKGFTMIELIFVIVIIGILAAVAIPKLAATRDDAKIATASSEIATAVSDIGTYYTAHGKFGKLSDMTNVKFVKATDGAADAKDVNMTAGATVHYNDPTQKSCLSFTTTATDGNLTVASETNSTSICSGLNKSIKRLETTTQFGGSSVDFNN